MSIAAQLGYRPNLLARSLTKRNTHIIAIAIDELKNLHAMRILDTVTKQLQARGYLTLMLNITAGDDYQSVIEMADQLQVDGIMFFANTLSNELYEIAHSIHSVPLIQVCRNSEAHLNIENINIDGFQAGREVGQLLLAQGYRRFGYLKGPDTESSHLLRMEGYQHALSSENLKIDLLLIAGKYERKAAYVKMKAYLAETLPEQRIDAIFCENDILAIGVLEALYEAGNIKSIAVVGFDGTDEADSPVWDLTTYDQLTEKQVSEAINRLTGGTHGDESEWRSGKLIVRGSHIKH